MDHSKTGLLRPAPSIGIFDKAWDFFCRLRGQGLISESGIVGRWKVYCIDTFDGTRWLDGEYDTRDQAEKSAVIKGDKMICAEVERPDGKRTNSYGG